MKFLSLTLPALLATSISAKPTFFTSDVSSADDDYQVPGDNPLHHCDDPKDDILAIKKIDISPNPPKAGEKLTITASGVLAEDVKDGAVALLTVKYGVITLIRQTKDLCDLVKNVDLECPLKKGDITLTKEVDIPKAIPPGDYSVQADILSVDDDQITCLKAEKIPFNKPGAASLFKQDI